MSLSPDQLVQLIHDSPGRVVLAATGGGSRAIADLLEVPGGSKTLIEAVVPYSASATIAWLGGPPDEFCSAATARAMAMAAFQKACAFEQHGRLAGVACTASLTSDRPKRGPHRIHVAVQTAGRTAAWHLQLLKQRRSRVEEERLAGHLTLNFIADACGLAERLELELLEGESVEQSSVKAPAEWQDLLLGKTPRVRVGPNVGRPTFVFPGAFNPLHSGHRRMFQIAGERLGRHGILELSIINVDKPP
ncbi:MAG: CinA family protein, partial [Pirellulales bacterium]|nr:CinA family protein [Pirellulales bacterium]